MAYLAGWLHLDLEAGALEGFDGDLHHATGRAAPSRSLRRQARGFGEEWARGEENWTGVGVAVYAMRYSGAVPLSRTFAAWVLSVGAICANVLGFF